ncbi:Tim44 domain-containing protein [Methyloversatilis thermotolerans]|uniref:Tim44 domain-containing protein n=1 Tax=Methyloversatilis thermotolerans TaxID=1346290 RepID=UPI00037ACE0C|nr:Tim44-like domain-containing protein [Methyloversatilis thermotolerans]
MKKMLCALSVVLVALTGAIQDAEAAKRMGGGKSFGAQRDSSVMRRDAAPAPAAPAQNAAAAQRQAQPGTPAAGAQTPKRSWMGPLAGLAAGLGLAALASHLGFGEELASFMMIGLLVLAALIAWRFFAARKAGAGSTDAVRTSPYAMAGNVSGAPARFESAAPAAGAAPQTSASPAIPADFDVDGFLRQAKLNFVRMQDAHDKGDIDDIRQFTMPEVFAEIRMQIQERGASSQHLDIVQLDAALLDLAEDAGQYVASVRFNGLIREDADAAPSAFDEVWHLAKPVAGDRGWMVAGIQQMQ